MAGTGANNQRQKYLLGVLVVIAAIYGYRQLGGLFGGSGDGFLGGTRSVDFGRVLETKVEPLAMARLEGRADEFEIGRDPWQYGRPLVVAPPPRRDPVAPVRVTRPTPVAPRETAPLTPPKPTPPPLDVEFLGSFGSEQRKIAVFQKEESLINALVGDVVNEKFRVHSIGLESVDLTFEGFPDTPPARLALKEKN